MDIIGLPGFVGSYAPAVAPAEFTLTDDVITFPGDNPPIVFETDGGVITFPGDNEIIVVR